MYQEKRRYSRLDSDYKFTRGRSLRIRPLCIILRYLSRLLLRARRPPFLPRTVYSALRPPAYLFMNDIHRLRQQQQIRYGIPRAWECMRNWYKKEEEKERDATWCENPVLGGALRRAFKEIEASCTSWSLLSSLAGFCLYSYSHSPHTYKSYKVFRLGRM